MRLYRNCQEMYSDVRRDIHEMGTLVHPETMQDQHVANDPRYATLELAPYTFMILDGNDRNSFLSHVGGNLSWAQQEHAERVGPAFADERGINPGEAWKLRRETWEPFLHEGHFGYTYSERFAQFADHTKDDYSILHRVYRELLEHPNTRQAIVPVFSPRDVGAIGGVRRIPCSMHYQFMRRGDQLLMHYVMRSSDFLTHFPYDIWLALQLQWDFAERLNLTPGRFTFFTGSLHLYAKDADLGVF